MSSDVMSVADVRRDLGDVLNRAHYKNEVVSIAKREKPFAVVASNVEGENLLRMRALASELHMDTGQLIELVQQAISDERRKASLLGSKK